MGKIKKPSELHLELLVKILTGDSYSNSLQVTLT